MSFIVHSLINRQRSFSQLLLRLPKIPDSVMGRSRYRFLDHQPHFLTCTIVNWLPLFSKPEVAQIILDSLDFLRSHQRISLYGYGYVVMENHLHLIVAANNLSKEIANFKSFTARSTIDWLKENCSRIPFGSRNIHSSLWLVR